MSLEQSEPKGSGWGEDRQGLGYTEPPGRCRFRSEDSGEPREDLKQRRGRSHPCEHLHMGLSLHSPLSRSFRETWASHLSFPDPGVFVRKVG